MFHSYLASVSGGGTPDSCSKAIQDCDALQFPNVFTLLQIACTIPATSCECERSASALRRLHTFYRACMGQERLSALALTHIHYDTDIDLDEVVTLFDLKHPRRMELNNII
jgi:hypothetical protein